MCNWPKEKYNVCILILLEYSYVCVIDQRKKSYNVCVLVENLLLEYANVCVIDQINKSYNLCVLLLLQYSCVL